MLCANMQQNTVSTATFVVPDTVQLVELSVWWIPTVISAESIKLPTEISHLQLQVSHLQLRVCIHQQEGTAACSRNPPSACCSAGHQACSPAW
jgi:hypothetical protein